MSRNIEYVTKKEMARILGVHPNTLDNLRKRGEGPAFVHLSSRLLRYPLLDGQPQSQTVI